MATISTWTKKQKKDWDAWVATRPKVIQDLARQYPPNRLYRLAPTGQRAILVSYCENGTVTVAITGQYNLVVFSRRVFGVNPSDLTECELPPAGEDVGDMAVEAGYTNKEIRTILIPTLKALAAAEKASAN